MSDKIKLYLYRRSTHFTHSKKRYSYDLSDLVKDDSVKWITYLNFSAAELDFDLVPPSRTIVPYTGDIITFRWENHKTFYGYVWKYQYKKDNIVSVKCFAPSRYLKNQDSIVFKAGTIADRFNNVCKRAGIKHKVIKKPTHKVKAEVCDGKTYFAMIQSAIDSSLKSTGHRYYVYDNYDRVELRRVPGKRLNLLVSGTSGMTDFDYSVDIDQTYNAIRVVHKDSKKSQLTAATAQAKKNKASKSEIKKLQQQAKKASPTSANNPKETKFSYTDVHSTSALQWGKLQKVVQAKDKANHAQLIAQAREELRSTNMANKTLTVTCIGNLDLVAGNTVTVKIDDFRKKLSNCPIIKATHNFGDNYTCEIEMKAGKSWQENGSIS